MFNSSNSTQSREPQNTSSLLLTKQAATSASHLDLSVSAQRLKLLHPVGFVDVTTTYVRLLREDMATVRKCAGADIAESEPAQWNQPRVSDDCWDQLYETVVSKCKIK